MPRNVVPTCRQLAVAKFIAEAYPEQAVLRRHPPPDARKLEALAKFCAKHNIQLDASSAGASRMIGRGNRGICGLETRSDRAIGRGGGEYTRSTRADTSRHE
eukprot:1179237-Prorocentrum_minimum.AAC.3